MAVGAATQSRGPVQLVGHPCLPRHQRLSTPKHKKPLILPARQTSTVQPRPKNCPTLTPLSPTHSEFRHRLSSHLADHSKSVREVQNQLLGSLSIAARRELGFEFLGQTWRGLFSGLDGRRCVGWRPGRERGAIYPWCSHRPGPNIFHGELACPTTMVPTNSPSPSVSPLRKPPNSSVPSVASGLKSFTSTITSPPVRNSYDSYSGELDVDDKWEYYLAGS